MQFVEEYEMLFELFDRLGVPCLDLLPALQGAFSNYSDIEIRNELWADPADAHLGARLR